MYGESHMDRSPCGTGTAAKLALLHHYGRLDMHQPYKNLSPMDTEFDAELERIQNALDAGKITLEEARGLREKAYEKLTAQGYHAMEGRMKRVEGESVAGKPARHQE